MPFRIQALPLSAASTSPIRRGIISNAKWNKRKGFPAEAGNPGSQNR